MDTLERELLIHYDREIVQRICSKYGFSPMKALEFFIRSQTYAMLRDPELAMTEFSPAGIFDMWEVEQITGDPRDSLYLRRDEVDA